MKAVLLNERIPSNVFTPEMIDLVNRHVELYPQAIGTQNAPEHLEALREAEVAFSTWGMPSWTEEQIAAWVPKLKIIYYAAGSVQGFARPFLARGVRVVSAWGANAVPVAEWTVAQIILANKGYFQISANAKNDYSASRELSKQFPGNMRVRVGLLGAGMIGKLVIQMIRALKLDIELWVFDPFLPEQKATELGVRKAELAELFENCHCVSNHLANKEEIRGILNYNLFNRMPPNAVFINTGRGAQVDEAGLCRALTEMPNRFAVLDVTDPEPFRPGNPLFALPNVLLTPHAAGSLGNECLRFVEYMVDELKLWQSGQPMRYEVSEAMLENMA